MSLVSALYLKRINVCSSVVLFVDVKPWDDETDMKEMENQVRTIEMDGLLWGQALLKPIGYGIHKLTINCVVVDDKVSTQDDCGLLGCCENARPHF